jgi:hypothetical protein
MRKLLYILPVILILGFAACENYVDITPTGKKTVDSTDTYYELIALPNRAYHPAAFALLSDNVWSKESNIIGNEFISWDGINMTFNEAANRKELSDNNLYENCYTYILRSKLKSTAKFQSFLRMILVVRESSTPRLRISPLFTTREPAPKVGSIYRRTSKSDE